MIRLFLFIILIMPQISFGDSLEMTGKQMYNVYCTQCHGVNGNGKGINTPYMNVQPRNHTSKKDMNHMSDKQLKRAIMHGGVKVSKSVEMPPWKYTFTDEEIDKMVAHLRVLCKCKGR